MRVFIFLFFSLTYSNIFAQNKLLFDGIEFNDSMTLVGMFYPSKYFIDGVEYNTDDESKSFLITSKMEFEKIAKTVEYGGSTAFDFDRFPFHIRLMQDGETIQEWIIYTYANKILFDHKAHLFDPSQLDGIIKSFPFRYEYKIQEFSTIDELEKSIVLQKNESEFLFLFETIPGNTFEGEFYIEINEDSKFISALGVVNYLKEYFFEVDKQFHITYKYINTYVINGVFDRSPSNIIIKVDCNLELYEKLRLDESFIIGPWKPKTFFAKIVEKK